MSLRVVRLVLILGVLGVAAGGVAPLSGQQVTMEFEEFEKGAIVSSVPHPGSDKVIRVWGLNPRLKGNTAVIFDSADPGPEDLDLGSPNRDFQVTGPDGQQVRGPGQGRGGAAGEPCQNDRPLGKLLIVDDDLKPMTEDGRVEVPDDLGEAGARLLLDFSDIGPVTIHGMAVVDVEEPDAQIWFYKVDTATRERRPKKKQVLAHYSVHTDDNGVARLFDPDLRNVPEEGCHVTLVKRRAGEVLQPVAGVMSIEVDFSGSGAIARVIYSTGAATK